MRIEPKIDLRLRHHNQKRYSEGYCYRDNDNRRRQVSFLHLHLYICYLFYYHIYSPDCFSQGFLVEFCFLLKYTTPITVPRIMIMNGMSRGFSSVNTDFLCLSFSSMINTISSPS